MFAMLLWSVSLPIKNKNSILMQDELLNESVKREKDLVFSNSYWICVWYFKMYPAIAVVTSKIVMGELKYQSSNDGI